MLLYLLPTRAFYDTGPAARPPCSSRPTGQPAAPLQSADRSAGRLEPADWPRVMPRAGSNAADVGLSSRVPHQSVRGWQAGKSVFFVLV